MKPFIVIGADHHGFTLKKSIKDYLVGLGLTIKDVTPDFVPGDDYPDVAKRVVKEVLRGSFRRGVLLCDTGAGVAIAANRFKGIRAVPCYTEFMARHARSDNNSNVLCLGQETTFLPLAKKIIDAWLAAKFSGAVRHRRRIGQIDRL